MDEPLLNKKTKSYNFVYPDQYSSSYFAFFIYPLKYIQAYNKKYFEAKKRNEKLSLDADFEDIPPLLKLSETLDDDIEEQINRMENIWLEHKEQGKQLDLYFLSYKTVPKQLNSVFIYLFLDLAFRLLYSFFMGKTIKNISQYFYVRILYPDNEELLATLFFRGLISAILMITIIFGYIYTERLFFALSYQVGIKLRFIFSGLLYRKLHRISLSQLNEISLGKFINILSSDLSLFESGLRSFSNIVVAPFVLVVGLAMMWSFFGVWSLISIGIIFLYMPIQSFIANFSEAPKKEKNQAADERLRIVSEIIDAIRILKQYTWEDLFKAQAFKIRDNEANAQTKIQIVQALGTSLSNTSIYISLLITLFLYIFVGQGQVSADIVFSSLLILSILRLWCVQQFSEGMLFVVNFRLVQKRVLDVLNIQEIIPKTKNKLQPQNQEAIEMQNIQQEDEYEEENAGDYSIVQFTNYFGYWSKEKFQNEIPVLRNLNLTIKKQKFTPCLNCIIGKIGCGKTSLLLSILKEVPYQKGELLARGKIAYVEQEPYVFQGTIKDNIIFGKEFDEDVYQQVLKNSCFEDDLKQLPLGDQTYVGEKGITLSGGQRARLSFARALYSDSDIYLLDDPLSAVDSKVAKNLFNKGIKQYLKDKIVILVTHHIHFAIESDYLIIMNNHEIKAQGEPNEVIENLGAEFTTYIEFSHQSSRQSLITSLDQLKNSQFSKLLTTISDKMSQQQSENGDLEEVQVEEKKQLNNNITVEKQILLKDMENEVSINTLVQYCNFGGGIGNVLIKIYSIFVIESFLAIVINRILGYWAKENEDFINGVNEIEVNHIFFFKLLLGLLIVVQVLSFWKHFSLQKKLFELSSNIYKCMLKQIVRAKVSFFDSTPSGMIMSRFSTDLNVADNFLQYVLSLICEGFTNFILVVLTVCYVNPIIFLPSIFFSFILYKIKQKFQPFMNYSRNSDAVTRGPLNTEVSSTLSGLIVIRAYQQGDKYIQNFQKLIYNNAKGSLGFSRTNTFLSVVVDFTLYFQTAIGTALVLYVALNNLKKTDPGEIGFSLLLLIQTGDNFINIFRALFLLEINLNSIERMFKLTDLESEADLSRKEDSLINQNWPQQGVIEFKNVWMRYELNANQGEVKYALRNLNFKITQNLKIGVVGRTGAGKSSLLQALFRMVELEKKGVGSGIFIDGENIEQFGLHFLRKRISIIPQQPVVFQGTIRRNLDPLGLHDDSQILQALEEVDLKEKVLTLLDGLSTDMTISSNVFSVGQKQLICLARALLQKNKIVVFDEATSNVDLKTDQFIQKMIKERFRDCTVLTIAHRLETIADYDRILVMDQGMIVEFNSPFRLLVKNLGDRELTNEEGVFGSMVLNTGKMSAKKIFNIAERAFLKKII